MEAALHQEVSKLAVQAYCCNETGIDAQSYLADTVSDVYIRNAVISRIGESNIKNSLIQGGSSGINCAIYFAKDEQDAIDVQLNYRVKPIIDILGFSGFSMGNRCRMKCWTGYKVSEAAAAGKLDDIYVYITENGSVYHMSRGCSYLNPKISQVSRENLSQYRSKDGSKYYPCELCRGENGINAFITDQGNRYHTSLACSGIKRTIYMVKKTETGGKGACSRCSHA